VRQRAASDILTWRSKTTLYLKVSVMNFSEYYATHHDRFLKEWGEFLSFKSISTDPAYKKECEECALWVKQQLEKLGGSAELLRGNGCPVVYGEIPGDTSKPMVLFYGHYDVQPVDPIEKWLTDPFTPTLKEGRLYARGAQDNKGQVTYFLKGLEALKSLGIPTPPFKIMIEGEEESGSTVLQENLSNWKSRLKADILMVCDTGMPTANSPTVTMGLRGMVSVEFRVKGPRVDLHSGMYGGIVKNPALAVCEVVAKAYNPDGSVAVPGFYDGVVDPAPEDRAMSAKLPLNIEQIESHLGVPLAGGEVKYSVVERRGFRPTLEVNGIGGGYQGEGGKTVIPSTAFVKLTSRVVLGQDPTRVLECIISHFEKNAPKGTTVEVVDSSAVGGALQLSTRSPVIQKVTESIVKAFGKEPLFMWEGASIPLVAALKTASGAEPVLVGFGLEEDLIHAPNESFSLEQFEQGYRYVTSFLSSL
jgi:acetylornithine deacetylase/succinyl-diaminopimelate desuccinylase-like protein